MKHVLSPFENPIGYFLTAFGIGAMSAVMILMSGFDKEFVSSTSPAAEEQVAAALAAESAPEVEISKPAEQNARTYIEIHSSCGPYFEEACVNARRGPGEEFAVITQLRDGVILETEGIVEANGRTWHKIVFNEPLRYPERVPSDWYVATEFGWPFRNEGAKEIKGPASTTSKYIVIDRSAQKLYAYNGEALFMEQTISTGIELTPTPRGTFAVYKKTPSRYMQGPLPGISDKYYDLPGVPWNLYFTQQGAVIHGAYWHDKFGQRWSNGCVNLPVEAARKLYEWADVGILVTVRD